MAKKIKLKRQDINKATNVESNIFDTSPLYYSGFCLTDNKEFAVFYTNEQFLVDNNIDKSVILEFNLSENDLNMVVNKKAGKTPPKKIPKDKQNIYEWFKHKYNDCVLYPIEEIFDIPVQDMVIVLEQDHGKPVGIIKLKQVD